MSHSRIFLSPPHMGGGEIDLVRLAIESNYVAPLGPMVDAFEKEFAAYTGIPHCVALSSGTAATHLALRHVLRAGRERCPGPGESRPLVIASTLTFIGSVTPAVFEGCELRFIDCERTTWNMAPGLLAEELADCEREGRSIAAVIPTDLYGQCCELPLITAICDRYGVPVICDSAEAMGARYGVTPVGRRKLVAAEMETGAFRHAGFDAWAAIFSFNGNKIITTSGGGMLASHDHALIEHARKLSQQARDPAPWYEHTEIGYNYRMSNVLAAIGRGQLRVLDERVRQRRAIFDRYRALLGNLPGITFMPEPDWSRGNRWLTVMVVDPAQFGADTHSIRTALERENIEARPVWKPMHLQPVFKDCRVRGGAVSESLFAKGLCLPSGTAMTDADVDRVAAIVRRCATANRATPDN